MVLEDRLFLENFELETRLLNEQAQREEVELNAFDLETRLIEKGVL